MFADKRSIRATYKKSLRSIIRACGVGARESRACDQAGSVAHVVSIERRMRKQTKYAMLPWPISFPTNSQKWSNPFTYRFESRDRVYSVPGGGRRLPEGAPSSLGSGADGTPGLQQLVRKKQREVSAKSTKPKVVKSKETRASSSGNPCARRHFGLQTHLMAAKVGP